MQQSQEDPSAGSGAEGQNKSKTKTKGTEPKATDSETLKQELFAAIMHPAVTDDERAYFKQHTRPLLKTTADIKEVLRKTREKIQQYEEQQAERQAIASEAKGDGDLVITDADLPENLQPNYGLPESAKPAPTAFGNRAD